MPLPTRHDRESVRSMQYVFKSLIYSSNLANNILSFAVPEGDECTPNPCGPNSGCRTVKGQPTCFCLPEFEGNPPHQLCALPSNPCNPSPCGPNTQCSVLSNGYSKCTCLNGYIDSPNTIRGCVEPKNPCEPSPCGYGAICDSSRNPVCSCPEPLVGNPFRECSAPAITELCQPGPCGRNSDCYVSNNLEQCYCRPGFIGDPYSGCREPPRTVCEPNPCGPGAQCSISPDGQSMCRCPDGMGGDPTSFEGCHGYECRINDDCGYDQACFGYRCKDPCPGACGVGASCKVEKHHPVCFCAAGLTGTPTTRCYQLDEQPENPPASPCQPSPCGINSLCTVQNTRPVCSCLPDYLGNPTTGCHPECTMNSDCSSDKACLNLRCESPCAGSVCGINAECRVFDHTATCACTSGFSGDAFIRCLPIAISINTTVNPCVPSPCGPQSFCNVYGDIAICDPCFGPDATNNPSCRPECISNSDCSFDKACLGQTCVDPCPGSCGHSAICTVNYHNPMCTCPNGLYGNPFEYCSVPTTIVERNPETCETIQCGPNTECRQQNGVLACVCKKDYFGNPLIGCRPECVINPDCPSDKACVSLKCSDPCRGACGVNAFCQVVNHFPVCYCPADHTGDALVACTVPRKDPYPMPSYPCDPSPCGPNSRCLPSPNGHAVCSCLPRYRGSPPACQPECVSSSECPQNKACINLKCTDPCPGICGANARCEVVNHNPMCSCNYGDIGDPFVSCYRDNEERNQVDQRNPCAPSPCGPNSICQIKQGRPVCSCTANYIGSPPHCRPECVLNSECPTNKACIREKCEDPCLNSCGQNAQCRVISHSAHCNCLEGYQGDAFIGCSRTIEPPVIREPCNPSPCGENALCVERNGVAKCTCIPPYIGDPYRAGCRPECVHNVECPSNQACIKQHCRDPCPGVCGTNAECAVINHVPSCACARGYQGDPFLGCHPAHVVVKPTPCEPSPCGANSLCRNIADTPICSCQIGYLGAPPSCRPECIVNSECDQHMSCINQKCKDPCPGTCGFNARCQVINHNPICSCPKDYIGNPFEQCSPKRKCYLHFAIRFIPAGQREQCVNAILLRN